MKTRSPQQPAKKTAGKSARGGAEWTPEEVRRWAHRRGLEVGARGRVPSQVVELYLARPSAVRRWARAHGIEIGSRGRVPDDVLESYLSRPAAVREWAKRNGVPVGERGRIPDDVLETYLSQFRRMLAAA